MKLQQFIKELQSISSIVHNPEKIQVRMADYTSVVKPIFKKNTVFITDIEECSQKRKVILMKNCRPAILKRSNTEN